MVETHWTHQLITKMCQLDYTKDDLRTGERQKEPAPEGRVPPSRPVSPVWPVAFHQAWGQGCGWEWKGHRDTGDLGEEVRAADIAEQPRASVLCRGPKKPVGGMTVVSFFLSYWNSATSRDWGVLGMDGGGGVREVVGILGSE